MQTVQYEKTSTQNTSRDRQIAKSVAINNLFGNMTKQDFLSLTPNELSVLLSIADQIANYIGRQ